MRDVHTHTTPHAHAGRARASGGRGRRAPWRPSPQAPVPLPVVRVEARIWGQPRPAQLCSGGRQRPAISGGWRRGFCPSCPLGSGWQVGRERAEGSFWSLPQKRGKRRPPPHRRQEMRHPNTRCKMQTHRRHPLIHPYTHAQFYLPLVAKIKLPSDTRSALRVSVQFNDD